MFGIGSIGGYGFGGYGGGMSGLNSIYGSMSAMNDYKLYQALSKRYDSTNASSGSTSSSSTTGSAANAAFVQQYQKQMSGLMDAANKVVNTSSGSVEATSSDSTTVSAEITWKSATRTDYEIDVRQLATRQINKTKTYTANGANDLSGAFMISSNSGDVRIDMSDYADMATNYDALAAAAKDINSAKMGVAAQVVMDDNNGAYLQIQSSSTGVKNSFNVADESGSFAADSGLSTKTQQAQDAVFTVNNRESTSSSNTVDLDGFKLEVTFKKTGSATVSVGQDTEETTSALKDLISAYNSALKFLNDNADMGSGVLKQMNNLLHLPISEKSLSYVGITVGKDGTLSLDKDTFEKKMAESSDLVNSIISGSYSLASGLLNDANQGMSLASQKLVDNTEAYTAMSYQKMMGGFSSSTYSTLLNYTNSASLLNYLA